MVRVRQRVQRVDAAARQSSDWAHDGGIYRPVQLLVTPKIFIERVQMDAEPDLARACDAARLRRWSATRLRPWREVAFQVFDDDGEGLPLVARGHGQLRAPGERKLIEPAGRDSERIRSSGTSTIPNLYRLECRRLERAFAATPPSASARSRSRGDGFLSQRRARAPDGRRSAWPAAIPNSAWPSPPTGSTHDHADLKDLNCVYTRVHWQQDRRVLDWCDRHGILIQTEVPDLGRRHIQGHERPSLAPRS